MTTTCINGDCLDIMKTLPDKSVDLFLCDLPYGCFNGGGIKRDTGAFAGDGCSWDIKIDLVAFWEQIRRLCRNDTTPVIMFCNLRFGMDLIQSNPSWFRYDLIWSKKCGTNFLSSNKRPMTSHELIFVFSKKTSFYKRIDQFVAGKPAKLEATRGTKNTVYGTVVISPSEQKENLRCPLSVIEVGLKRDRRHPTAKPVELLKWLIERYSNEGDTVLDPTAGSFNSGRASLEVGRNYIGIELDKDFYDKNKLTV